MGGAPYPSDHSLGAAAAAASLLRDPVRPPRAPSAVHREPCPRARPAPLPLRVPAPATRPAGPCLAPRLESRWPGGHRGARSRSAHPASPPPPPSRHRVFSVARPSGRHGSFTRRRPARKASPARDTARSGRSAKPGAEPAGPQGCRPRAPGAPPGASPSLCQSRGLRHRREAPSRGSRGPKPQAVAARFRGRAPCPGLCDLPARSRQRARDASATGRERAIGGHTRPSCHLEVASGLVMAREGQKRVAPNGGPRRGPRGARGAGAEPTALSPSLEALPAPGCPASSRVSLASVRRQPCTWAPRPPPGGSCGLASPRGRL